MMDYQGYISELDKIPFPTINYRQRIHLGFSVVNFFALAMTLFMVSAPMMGWIGYETPTLGTAYMFGGFGLYLMGFYDWYTHDSLISFLDFIFSLLFFTFYYTADLGKYNIWVPNEYYTYMQGVFYCLWFALFIFLIIATKNAPCITKFFGFLIGLALIFVIVWEFHQETWPRKTAGYIIFIASIIAWIIGLLRLFKNVFS